MSGPAITFIRIAASRTSLVIGADLIQGRGKGDQTVPRDSTISWLQTDPTAKCGRLADRAPGVRSESGETLVSGHHSCRTAARTARDARESHGLRVGPNAEFSVEDPMANSSMLPSERYSAGGAKLRDNRRIVGSDVPLQNL